MRHIVLNYSVVRFLGYSIILMLMFACDNVSRSLPVEGLYGSPEQVKNVEVTNLPGGARLQYNLPSDEGLRYVAAEYYVGGKKTVRKSSYYDNSVTVEGFATSGEYEVSLYTVSWSNARSAPTTVRIHPLEPSYITTFNSLKPQPTFGGVYIGYENVNEADIQISVIMPDSVGDWMTLDTHYTNSPKGGFAVRGLTTDLRRFGFYVRDRWNNYSDTLYAEFAPLFEMELDRTRFAWIQLPTDVNQFWYSDLPPRAWDGTWGAGSLKFSSASGSGMPQWFTMDLGVKAELSRIKHYHHPETVYGATPKILEVWGTTAYDADGSWDSWTLLGSFTEAPPSGNTTPNANDRTYAIDEGYDLLFEPGIPAVQYIRWKCVQNFVNTQQMVVAELRFYGKPVE
ncbi:MAG: DUF4959 domain-containing protein [Tannerella sp.]|nr:DUF4959 domain-containing protein [Tannerella sp.]